jgi:hypothetical protein
VTAIRRGRVGPDLFGEFQVVENFKEHCMSMGCDKSQIDDRQCGSPTSLMSA